MLQEYPIIKILRQLSDDDLLPAIVFRSSRRSCDDDSEHVLKANKLELSADKQEAIMASINKIISHYSIDQHLIYSHEQIESVVRFGVGAHHAGQLLVWRLLLEELMSQGALRLLVATGTVAAGVDFPARTVVVTAHSRRGAEGFRALTASELQQMSGRAGRRGRDTLGICVAAPGPYCDARILADVALRPPEPLKSAYYASPSTVLNLLKFRNIDDLKFTVDKSLAHFHDKKTAQKLRSEAEQEILKLEADAKTGLNEGKRKQLRRCRKSLREAEELEGKQIKNLEQTLSGLEKLHLLEDGKITEKGLWGANLCTHLLLELCEAIDSFLINSDTQLEQLIGLVASIAGDSHRTYLAIRQVPVPKEKFKKLEEIVLNVRGAFETPFNPELKVIPAAAVTVLTWLEVDTWQNYNRILKLGGVADGDAARLIMQTAEHLSQISRLHETHTELARLAGEGKRRLLRPPLSEELVD